MSANDEPISSSRDCHKCDGGRLMAQEGICAACNGLSGVGRPPKSEGTVRK